VLGATLIKRALTRAKRARPSATTAEGSSGAASLLVRLPYVAGAFRERGKQKRRGKFYV
jgi:hypothetical protein